MHKSGNLAGPARELERATSAYRRLVAAGSSDWSTLRNLAKAHIDLAETLADAGNRIGAAAEYREARRIYAGLRDRGELPAAYVKEIGEIAVAEAAVLRFR